jgi:predicted O-methyltransferase YrrM
LGRAFATLRRYAGFARFAVELRGLPPVVALFFLRARRYARRTGDQFSLDSSMRPADVNLLVQLARGSRTVVELGTGTAWSAIALALSDSERQVVTYDLCNRPEREAYLERAWPSVRSRIDFRHEPDTHGPRAGEAVEFLFVDSAHDRESVGRAFSAWRSSLRPGAVVVFHDYGHPRYPGVRQGIQDLALAGCESGGMYVWRVSNDRTVNDAR